MLIAAQALTVTQHLKAYVCLDLFLNPFGVFKNCGL